MTKEEYSVWVKKTSKHRKEIERAMFVACYHCLKTYSSSLIIEWCDRDQTAICPLCNIDAVLPFNIIDHEDEWKLLEEAREIGFAWRKKDNH